VPTRVQIELASAPDEARRTRSRQDDASKESLVAWTQLIVAGVLEVCWAVGLKYTDGFTRPWPTALTVSAIVASMVLLARATRDIPIGTAYAVWVGIGALGAATLGVVLFREPLTLARGVFLGLLLVSILGLKLTSSS
jgi:quaternary ammonium compound-resistance protein SugE